MRRVAPTITFACARKSGRVSCLVTPRDAGRASAKVSARLLGTKRRASARSRGKVRLRLKARARTARVELRYVSSRYQGRAVVRVGRTVKVRATSR